jgi:hypothetical protein
MASTDVPHAFGGHVVEPVELAAVLAPFILLASMVSVELGVTVALVELTLGVTASSVSSVSTAPTPASI